MSVVICCHADTVVYGMAQSPIVCEGNAGVYEWVWGPVVYGVHPQTCPCLAQPVA